MRDDEPLEGWLFQVQLHAEHGRPPYPQGTSREALDRLAQVLAAQPYPRVIEAKGKAPRQYHSWDEDDGDDES